MIKKLMLIGILSTPSLVSAALMMENRDADGEISRIYIEGNKARIEMPTENAYMVMDVQQRTMKMVSHRERTVMDFSDMFKDQKQAGQSGTKQKIDSRLVSKGVGPKIAGYETEEYEIRANDQYCGSTFVSVEALKQGDLKRFGSMLEKMSGAALSNMDNMMGGQMQSFMPPCVIASEQQMDRLMNLGIPMRVIDENRQLESEVTRFDKNAKLPAKAFDIPADYKQTNPTEMMGEAAKQIRDMQPQMEEMMKNMPPEAMEMMRKQMQQFQQQ